ncbi:hybrid sensor histidine kinase/response regulator transcription factor [Joostella sp.]|uniref:hybrid sensor histidine kinase/response regulator transcription factor n=1 Tax=Joostella sp. TaxID=2231138 RepID=UPI003A8D384A
MRFPTLLLLIFHLIFVQIGYNQNLNSNPNTINERLKFHLFDIESGLSNNVIYDIEQDSLGFIWIATSDGLNRYDGKEFKKFRKNDSNLISFNTIYQLKLNENGNLFLATDNGLVSYDQKKESFEFINNSSNCFDFDQKGNPLIGAYKNGIHIFKNGESKIALRKEKDNSESISSNNVISLKMQSDSVLWAGTRNDGINKINYKTKKVINSPLTKKLASLKTINCIYEDQHNNIWIGSKQGIDIITKEGEVIKINKGDTFNNGLSDNEVLSFQEDNNHQMWIGTRNGGLNILNVSDFFEKKSNTFIRKFLPREDGSSIYNRTISSLKLDRDGGMWIGTSTGLNYVNTQGDPVQLLQKKTADKESLSNDRIGAIAESYNGKIWIGTDGGGLDLFDPNTGKYKHFNHDENNKNSLSNNYILSLCEDSNKRLWVGTYQDGINLLNPITGTFKHYLSGTREQGSDVRRIFEDNSGNIWAGTNRGGLYKYDENLDQFIYIKKLGKIDIRDIEEDKDGALWLATHGNGILKYSQRNNLVTSYNKGNSKLASDVIFSIEILSDGDILAGTAYNGLVRINRNGNGLNFTELDGLSNNSINSIVIENQKTAWLGTLKGISRYNLKNHQIDNLNMFDNVKNNDFILGAGLITKNGRLYFGGNKGLNTFIPSELFKSNSKYTIVLEGLNIFNKPITVEQKDEKAILNESIAFKKHIYLNHDKSQFSIDFSILKYPISSNITYSYILEGYQDHWVNLKNAHTLNLNNIPPGHYTLKIKGKTGLNNEIVKELLITINPPFWKTTPAYLLYFLILAGICWSVFRYYHERIKLQNLLLFEKKQRQLENDLNIERIQFFTSFSHELKTPLTLIMNPIQDLLFNVKNPKNLENVKLIHKNSNYLYKSIHKLLEFRKSEIGHNQLHIHKYNIYNCISTIIGYYTPLTKSREITLIFKSDNGDLKAWIDIEKIEIIVHNLISNALKHCEADDQITISLNTDKQNFYIKVEDSGKGISKKDIPLIFDWFYQSGSNISKKGTGVGLALSKNFAQMHSGTITVESKLNVGTTFIVSIPRDKELFKNAIICKESSPNEIEKSELLINEVWNPVTNEKETNFKFIDSKNDDEKEVLLLIDDNLDILKYLQNIFSEHYNLIFAKNGNEGLQKAIDLVPNLIISDVMMPKKSGIDLCASLKENNATSHIPIILLTAKDNEESMNLGFNIGADDYITKPFNSKILKSRVKNLLNNRMILKNHFSNKSNKVLSAKDEKLVDKEQEFLNQLKETILEQLKKEEISVDVIAKSIGMSRSSLFRKIKAITGMNSNEYIRQVRIRKAAYLIESEGFTISQAAYEVGFNSTKYFRKIFKQEFDQLPSELQSKE